MIVLKFGGTSVGSVSNLKRVIDIVDQYVKSDNVIVVVSALGGITDLLLEAGHKAQTKDIEYKTSLSKIKDRHSDVLTALLPNKSTSVDSFVQKSFTDLELLLDGIFLINELSVKTQDRLLSFGELLSSFIIAEIFINRGYDAICKNSQELILTDNSYTSAQVNFEISNKNITKYFNSNKHKINVLPGFIAKSESGESTTLGRGGSDYTAAIIASALNVSELFIWTDVSGMYTANPKIVKNASPIKNISYQEAMELSHFGAKVLYPPTIQPALKTNIPIHIKNTTRPDDFGTIISNEEINNQNAIRGISNVSDVALLTLQGSGMIGIPGFSKRLFETLSREKINVILITQASSEHSICVGINQGFADKAKKAIDNAFDYEIKTEKIDPLIVEMDLSIIAIVGDPMKDHQGISGKMFSALGRNNISVRAIAQGASEKNISAVIKGSDSEKCLNILHERFFESKSKSLNIFIAGVGNVGERLVEQFNKQHDFLKTRSKLNVNIIGLSNSKKMIFDKSGIDLNNWKKLLQSGERATVNGFYEKVRTYNLRNSIFVDVTANPDVANFYKNYLSNSIGVVACNKIACSGSLDYYKDLKSTALKFNASFFYETNVGAGLPVLNTLNNLVLSGDKILSIHAVLSGSLNFIFNSFNEDISFHDVVREAAKEGYTEPDPRIDLSGVDVARKILILARESGFDLELEEIENVPFLSESGLKSKDVSEFYESLKNDQEHYQNLFVKAKEKGCRLKYVASYSGGKARVALEEIEPGHPFFNLEGKDNIVMFYTDRYPDQPMIIKGAGAGAEVTASGLFADIIRTGNQ